MPFEVLRPLGWVGGVSGLLGMQVVQLGARIIRLRVSPHCVVDDGSVTLVGWDLGD